MPKEEKKTRGVFERSAGSGVCWIQYFADGKRHREKVGRKSDAIRAYQRRKSDAAYVRATRKLAPTDPQTSNLNHGLIAQLQADIADLNQKMDRIERLIKRVALIQSKKQDSNTHTEPKFGDPRF